ncbi:hypothetical protein EVAR_61047_1 [Eumeta japonica]|uniref:Uncharacterized protein n=1 Tax=Eumeta variegata TaxID=151549 RepID=A0A4C1Z4J1_EUMVA|nr:hypothetical protein EVAR_61047_1 [Eumeta japonica]
MYKITPHLIELWRPTTCVRNIEDSSERNYGMSVEITELNDRTLPCSSIPRASLRCQDATTRYGVRRPYNEARTRLAMRPTLAVGAETIKSKND